VICAPAELYRYTVNCMYVSTRIKLCEGQETWREFVSHSGIDHVKEVRSADPHVNDYVFVDGQARPHECTVENLFDVISQLPRPESANHYYQLAINLRYDEIPELPASVKLLGFDILNDDMESLTLSLGVLATDFTEYRTRANSFALFSKCDAEELALKLPPPLT